MSDEKLLYNGCLYVQSNTKAAKAVASKADRNVVTLTSVGGKPALITNGKAYVKQKRLIPGVDWSKVMEQQNE